MKKNLGYYAFLALPLLLYLILFIYPNATALVWSLFKWDGFAPQMEFVGLGNFVKLFTKQSVFSKALINTIVYTIVLAVGSNLLGLIFALLIHKKSALNNIFRTIFYLPAVLATVAIGSMWTLGIYNPSFGALNSFLTSIGLESLTTAWLANPSTALFCVASVHVWQNLGFSMILYIAGIQDIPEELYESASIDGANPFQQTWYITLPLLKRVATVVLVIVTIFGMRAFDLVFIMTESGSATGATEVLTTFLFRQGFTYRKVGFANAIAVVLLMVVVGISVVQQWILREKKS
ncbi:MAG: sugar ABC transporter permease [bacterium]|nr:sugar ABC transporter permease [bacterium]